MMIPNTFDLCSQNFEIKEEPTIIPTALRQLKWHQVWPQEGESRLRYYVKAHAILFYYASVGACFLGYIYDIKQRGVNIGYEGELAVSVAVLSQSFVSLVVLRNQQAFSKLFKELSSFDDFGKPTGFEKTEHKLKILTNLVYFGTICGLSVYEIVPIFERSRCKEYNMLHNLHEVCGLYAPIWSILHINGLPTIYFYFIYQVIAAFIGMPPIALLPVMAYSMHEHVAARIKHLKEKLRFWGKKEKVTRGMLNEFIEHHQYIIRLMEKVNGATSVPMCVHVFMTSSVIILILHQILNVTWRTPGGPIMHMLMWFLGMYINSIGGQRVKDESMSVADEIYNHVEWYKMDITTQKELLIITCRAQKALVVSTGPFGYMDLELLLTMVKGLYSFCISSLSQRYL